MMRSTGLFVISLADDFHYGCHVVVHGSPRTA